MTGIDRRAACQMVKWCGHFNLHFRGFLALEDLYTVMMQKQLMTYKIKIDTAYDGVMSAIVE